MKRIQPRLDHHWVEQRFDRIASSYWFFERLFLVPRHARKKAVQELGIRPGDRVLSIGCGHGPDLLDLSRAVGVNGSVVGVDLSDRMLDLARARINKHRLANVELVHADIHAYSTDVRFNAVLLPFSLTSSGDPLALLQLAWELMENGGVLVVLDAQLPPRVARTTKSIMPLIRRFLEATVLGDPDMDPLKELRKLGSEPEVEWYLGRTYFVASMVKPHGRPPRAQRTTTKRTGATPEPVLTT